jgi:hypothetical protein
MSKLNVKVASPGPVSPLKSVAVPGVVTYEGGQGVVSDSKTELFRLGVNLFYGNEGTFYEKGKERDKRFTDLVEKVTLEDPMWTVEFLSWLRNTANIRTAAIVGAAHFVYTRLSNDIEDDYSIDGKGLSRYVIPSVLSRADEPGEFIAYWKSTFCDPSKPLKLPKPVKRGIADSTQRYNEYTVLKYGTDSHDIRFSDVLNLTHAKPKNAAGMLDKLPAWRLEEMSEEDTLAYSDKSLETRKALFKYIIDKRYDNDTTGIYNLSMINANAQLRKDAAKDVKVLLDASRVKEAGMTWEDVLSLGGSKLDKAKLWESVIPNMGIMALIRNLRNFEEAGISKDSRNYVVSQLTNPKVIAKSRQFPYRFLSAYQNTNSLQYHAALEEALELATQNIPSFDSSTLVLIDTSGSMSATISNNSKMTRAGTAALFGAAVAARNPKSVDLIMFGSTSKQLIVKPGTSVLKVVEEVERRNNEVGSGTETAAALKKHYDPKKHKRVMIFTDGQSFGSRSYGYWGYGAMNVADFPFEKKTFVYAFDLAGYQVTDLPTGKNRQYQLGGLTDSTFKLIPMIEQSSDGHWPWEYSE